MANRRLPAWCFSALLVSGCSVLGHPESTRSPRPPRGSETGSSGSSGDPRTPDDPTESRSWSSAGLVDELTPIYADADAAEAAAVLTSDTPRGVPAGVHVVVSGLAPGDEVRCALELDGRSVPGAAFFALIDVPVEQNTGIESRTEAWGGGRNPDVIRRAPFRVHEVLQPSAGLARANDQGVAALRVEVPVGASASVGTRRGSVVLSGEDERGPWARTLAWNLVVHEAIVPTLSTSSPGYTNWFSLSLIARRHGLRKWSEPFWVMLEAYADLMARGRQNAVRVRWNDFARVEESGQLRFRHARFDRFVRIFLERGFSQIHGGHLAVRHAGDWSSSRLDLQLNGADVESDAGRRMLDELLDEVVSALETLDLSEDVVYLQHIADEPTGRNAAAYRFVADRVRARMPGVRTFDATMSRGLAGAVDVWCPQVHEFQQHRDFFERRRRAGDGIWVYTCLVPGGPWINRLLDQERLRPVLVGWALVQYDLDGYLHWGLNHYRRDVDPYRQSVVPHGSGPPNFLPAGDSHIVYPGPDGPCSGQRFEAHRIGMEDAELLRILQARDARAAEALVARVFRAFDDYEKDVAAYRMVRRDLLRAVSMTP